MSKPDKFEKKFRPVNKILGESPRLGPFPAEQIFPWIGITLSSIFIFHYVFNAGWLITGLVAGWGCSTWWVLSANKDYFGKFIGVPRISRGYMRFTSLVNRPTQTSKRRKSRK
ncbi:hypothetical protein PN456_17245 [Nodularia spumigena CS-586/05]|uniref:hypothetical protein n=1 Tax=Nodularia spumigena TaxID=70799 RepID=UPI00232F01FB|nr:hypothetical protein [Nodularia spumigena]MDB9344580.1 hypothetical protein [Nodularia spumigena CS-588/06]MDB9370670.1 hypothetical protein [Nodularia spumigena CS-586/05]